MQTATKEKRNNKKRHWQTLNPTHRHKPHTDTTLEKHQLITCKVWLDHSQWTEVYSVLHWKPMNLNIGIIYSALHVCMRTLLHFEWGGAFLLFVRVIIKESILLYCGLCKPAHLQHIIKADNLLPCCAVL